MSEAASRRLWSDFLYERLPWPTPLPGVLLSLALLASLIVLGNATGAFELLAAEGMTWWESRDGRMVVLLALFAGVVPTAFRYHELGTRADLAQLRRANAWSDGLPPVLTHATTGHRRSALRFGLSGVVLVPIIAYSVDRDVALYFSSLYWGFAQIWTWCVGLFVSFAGGVYTYRAYSDARAFASLARVLPEVDLLERHALLPFARQGLRSAVPGVIFVAFLAPNLGDEGFLFSIVSIGLLVAIQNLAVLMLPLRGLRDRLRKAKREEIARVNAAIRGEADALEGSPLDVREPPSLADLLAWRSFVESVPEWPIDVSTLGRFAFYVGIPLLSWVGAALVERALDLVIG